MCYKMQKVKIEVSQKDTNVEFTSTNFAKETRPHQKFRNSDTKYRKGFYRPKWEDNFYSCYVTNLHVVSVRDNNHMEGVDNLSTLGVTSSF